LLFPVERDCYKNRVSDQPSFENINFGRSVLFIFTKLTMQSLCSVSIVKRDICCNLFLDPRTKRRKYNIYIYIYIYIYRRKTKKRKIIIIGSEERMSKHPEND
jgi:hypothetical protein